MLYEAMGYGSRALEPHLFLILPGSERGSDFPVPIDQDEDVLSRLP
jgi:hypothetical protein